MQNSNHPLRFPRGWLQKCEILSGKFAVTYDLSFLEKHELRVLFKITDHNFLNSVYHMLVGASWVAVLCCKSMEQVCCPAYVATVSEVFIMCYQERSSAERPEELRTQCSTVHPNNNNTYGEFS